MEIKDLDITDSSLTIYVKTKNKDDIEILKEILHGILCAHFQVLKTFEGNQLPIGVFKFEYDYVSDKMSIRTFVKQEKMELVFDVLSGSELYNINRPL